MAESKLKIDIRRGTIAELAKKNGRVYVTELAKLLNVTPVTIRNDLDALEKDGFIIRMNGGAVYAGRGIEKIEKKSISAAAEIPCINEKQAIAKAVSQMICDGDTLFINSGTTTQLIASELRAKNGLNIVTNSISAAMLLGSISTFRVILLGGEINVQYGFTFGGDAQEKLSHYHADHAILAVDGIDTENGITTHHAQEAILDRMMINGAANVIVAADHTKIGRTGFLRVCECKAGIHLVTDRRDASYGLDELRECGITVTEA